MKTIPGTPPIREVVSMTETLTFEAEEGIFKESELAISIVADTIRGLAREEYGALPEDCYADE